MAAPSLRSRLCVRLRCGVVGYERHSTTGAVRLQRPGRRNTDRGAAARRRNQVAPIKRTAQDIIDIGAKLAEVKERLGHGKFRSWITAEFDWSHDTAINFMNVASAFGEMTKISSIAPSALYALAAPSTPPAARTEAIERATRGEAITHSTAKAIIEEHAPAAERIRKREERDAALPALPLATAAGPFDLLYVDPPWRYDAGTGTPNRLIENQYPTMTIETLCAMAPAIAAISAQDCVLLCWATSPKLAEALQVIAAWSFTYRTCAVWVKPSIGPGYYWRQRQELLLLAIRGNPGTPPESARVSSVIEAPRLEHSAKPEQVYTMLEAMYPRARRAELFARSQRAGWVAWGNQAPEVHDAEL